jgi:hypothetical protein
LPNDNRGLAGQRRNVVRGKEEHRYAQEQQAPMCHLKLLLIRFCIQDGDG